MAAITGRTTRSGATRAAHRRWASLLLPPRADHFQRRDAQVECPELGREQGNAPSYGRLDRSDRRARGLDPRGPVGHGRPHGASRLCAWLPLVQPRGQNGLSRTSLGAVSFSTMSGPCPESCPRRRKSCPESCPRRQQPPRTLAQCVERLARKPGRPLPARSGTLRIRAGAGIVVTLPGETNDLYAPRRFMIICHSRGLHRTYLR